MFARGSQNFAEQHSLRSAIACCGVPSAQGNCWGCINSCLLLGQALADAQEWAQEKRLGDEDYRFLAASVERDRRETQMMLEAERSQAITPQLHQSRRNRRLQRWLLGAISTGCVLSTGFGWLALSASQRASQNEQLARQSEVKALVEAAQGWFDSNRRLDALIQAMRAQRQLTHLAQPP